jgi:hypothetical protein
MSFGLAEMLVNHGQLRLSGQEASNAKHSQPPNHQLIKVVLCTLIRQIISCTTNIYKSEEFLS